MQILRAGREASLETSYMRVLAPSTVSMWIWGLHSAKVNTAQTYTLEGRHRRLWSMKSLCLKSQSRTIWLKIQITAFRQGWWRWTRTPLGMLDWALVLSVPWPYLPVTSSRDPCCHLLIWQNILVFKKANCLSASVIFTKCTDTLLHVHFSNHRMSERNIYIYVYIHASLRVTPSNKIKAI